MLKCVCAGLPYWLPAPQQSSARFGSARRAPSTSAARTGSHAPSRTPRLLSEVARRPPASGSPRTLHPHRPPGRPVPSDPRSASAGSTPYRTHGRSGGASGSAAGGCFHPYPCPGRRRRRSRRLGSAFPTGPQRWIARSTGSGWQSCSAHVVLEQLRVDGGRLRCPASLVDVLVDGGMVVAVDVLLRDDTAENHWIDVAALPARRAIRAVLVLLKHRARNRPWIPGRAALELVLTGLSHLDDYAPRSRAVPGKAGAIRPGVVSYATLDHGSAGIDPERARRYVLILGTLDRSTLLARASVSTFANAGSAVGWGVLAAALGITARTASATSPSQSRSTDDTSPIYPHLRPLSLFDVRTLLSEGESHHGRRIGHSLSSDPGQSPVPTGQGSNRAQAVIGSRSWPSARTPRSSS